MSLVPLPSCVFNPTCPIGISQEMPPTQNTQSWFYCLHPETLPEVGPEPGPPGWWVGGWRAERGPSGKGEGGGGRWRRRPSCLVAVLSPSRQDSPPSGAMSPQGRCIEDTSDPWPPSGAQTRCAGKNLSWGKTGIRILSCHSCHKRPKLIYMESTQFMLN